MNSPTTRPVVVGVDGRPGSAGALRYAVTEARRRRAPLQLVHVVPDNYSSARSSRGPTCAGSVLPSSIRRSTPLADWLPT